MTLEEAIKRYTDNAEYERTHGNLQGCMEFKQLAEWLRKYQKIEQQPCYNPDEWCHDCSEYNHDKHCCPRYNKVIRSAVEEMKQCEDTISRYGVPHKIAEFFSKWDGDENAKMEISVDDMREIAFVYSKKARIEWQFKAMRQEKQPKIKTVESED